MFDSFQKSTNNPYVTDSQNLPHFSNVFQVKSFLKTAPSQSDEKKTEQRNTSQSTSFLCRYIHINWSDIRHSAQFFLYFKDEFLQISNLAFTIIFNIAHHHHPFGPYLDGFAVFFFKRTIFFSTMTNEFNQSRF